MPLTPTIPGTETKVTPDMQDPIMAKATTHQLVLRLPRKKALLSPPRAARRDTTSMAAK